MNMQRITPFLFLFAALAWLVAGGISTANGDTQVTSYGLAAVFVALSLVYFRKARQEGDNK